MNITNELDRIANEIEKIDPVIALAIDKISDQFEKTAGIIDKVKKVIQKVSPEISEHMKTEPITKDKALSNLVKIIRAYPNVIKDITDLLGSILQSGPLGLRSSTMKGASSPDMVGVALSSLLSLTNKNVTPKDLEGQNNALVKNIMSLIDSVEDKAKEISLKFRV